MKPSLESRIYRLLVIIGGGALLLAMSIDTLAVIGRHTGIPLLGSIELVQILIGIAGALSILVATVHGSHATVRLIVSRLTATPRRILFIANQVSSTGFLLALSVGSAWLSYELWNGMEESELWHLPYKPLRLLITGSMLMTALLFLAQAWKGNSK